VGPTILTVLAHPDDESFGPAALLVREARAGARVHGLFATRGEHGQTHLDPAPSRSELARMREQDLREAADLIGYADVELLGYADGGLADLPAGELEGRVRDALRRHRPAVVITFGPAGVTRHPDHVAISRATTAAFHRARAGRLDPRALFYQAVGPEEAKEQGIVGEPDAEPNTFLDVAETQPIKLAALRLHARHMTDATEMLRRLEARPESVAMLHRAWPPVAHGRRLTTLLPRTASRART
jgi:LmbE family N-acetylglucosaminyl deacetylase